MSDDRKRELSDETERLMDIVGDVVGSETPEGKELIAIIARWEVAEGEAKACAERLREMEGSWHLTYNENLALREGLEMIANTTGDNLGWGAARMMSIAQQALGGPLRHFSPRSES